MRLFFPNLDSFSKMPKLSDYETVAQEYAIRASTTMNTSLHIAFLYGRGGALIAMSTNGIGSRSRGAGYSKYTIHAERAVLKMVGDNTLLKGATLVVVRVSKKGELMSSMPCHECKCHLTKAIDKYGLRRVYYSAPANAPPTLTSDPPARTSTPDSSRPVSPTPSQSSI
jgi:5-deoxy-D-glucuronate isomerase